jgi:hypothetical protein
MDFPRRISAGFKWCVAVGVAASLVFGCRGDWQEILVQEGDYLLDFVVDLNVTGGVPAGSHVISDFQIAAVDETVPDAFARAQSLYVDGLSWVTGCKASGEFDCTGWEFPMRNGSEDTRLPALQDNDATYLAGIVTDSIFGDPLFLLVVNGGLDASTGYTVTLERSALTVNEGLDAVNVLFDNPDFGDLQKTPDAADALAALGGTAGTTLGSNPYEIGTFTTNAAGATGLLQISFTGTGNEDIIETNSLQGFDLPYYNYVVIYNTSSGEPVARAQVGVDLDASGGAVNNALAPYPDAAFTLAEALAAPGVAGKASDLTFTFANLAELSSTYQVWLYSVETEEFFSPTGTFTATDVEGETVATGTDVQTFNTQGDWTNTFQTTNPEVSDYTHVVLSIESAAATSPSAVQLLWSQYTDMAGAPTDPFLWTFLLSGDAAFGTFAAGDPTTWSAGGLGDGAVWGDEVCEDPPDCPEGANNKMIVNYRNLPLPPAGYFYEAWLVSGDGSEQLAIGDLVSPFEEGYASLRDVDETPGITGFARDGIIVKSSTVTQRAGLPAGTEFYDYLMYHLTLSPKLRSGEMPPTTALGGVLPESLFDRKPPEGGG